jgi:hypothetical protein
VTTPFHESVMRFQRQDFYTERVLEGGISAGGCLVEDNREAIAQGFLNYKSPMRFGEEPNWLVCLDTDIKFDPEIIYGLLDAADPVERPIVTALYFTTISDNFTACWMRKNPADNDYVTYLSVDPGLNRINACGLGCAIIHRSVLEKIKAKYENTDSFTWFGRNRVQLLKSGWTRLGEDVTFCARAESVGATIWGHSDLRVGHFKVREENAETMKERLDARRLAELEGQASVIDAEKVRQAAVDVFYVQGEKAERGFINGSGYKGEFGDHA